MLYNNYSVGGVVKRPMQYDLGLLDWAAIMWLFHGICSKNLWTLPIQSKVSRWSPRDSTYKDGLVDWSIAIAHWPAAKAWSIIVLSNWPIRLGHWLTMRARSISSNFFTLLLYIHMNVIVCHTPLASYFSDLFTSPYLILITPYYYRYLMIKTKELTLPHFVHV